MDTRKQISPLFLLLLATAAMADDQFPPPPKPEPDPEPDLGSRVRLSDASGQEVILDGVEWEIGVDHAAETPVLFSVRSFDEPPDEHYTQGLRQRLEGTATLHRRPVPNREPLWPASQPWIPSRRVADPAKKRARKAQKRARRAGR